MVLVSLCPNDSQLYSISGPDGQFLAAVKTVDNFMIASNSSTLTEYLYEAVRSAGYTILQEAKDKFVGSQISRLPDGTILVHQEYHAKHLMRKYGIRVDAPTPLSSTYTGENYALSKTSPTIPIKQYQAILGDVTWMTLQGLIYSTLYQFSPRRLITALKEIMMRSCMC